MTQPFFSELTQIWRRGARLLRPMALVIGFCALALHGFDRLLGGSDDLIRRVAQLLPLSTAAFAAFHLLATGRDGPPGFWALTAAPGDAVGFVGRVFALAILAIAPLTPALMFGGDWAKLLGVGGLYVVFAWLGVSLLRIAAGAPAGLNEAAAESRGRLWRRVGLLALSHGPLALLGGLIGGHPAALIAGQAILVWAVVNGAAALAIDSEAAACENAAEETASSAKE